MDPVVPTDEFALGVSYLMASVAASSSFQSWTSTADATAALERVYPGEAPDDADSPLAVVWMRSREDSQVASGASDEFEGDGTLMLQLLSTTESTDRAQAYIAMLNRAGAMRKDLMTLSGVAGYLSFSSLSSRVFRFQPADAVARGRDIWIALFEVKVRP